MASLLSVLSFSFLPVRWMLKETGIFHYKKGTFKKVQRHVFSKASPISYAPRRRVVVMVVDSV